MNIDHKDDKIRNLREETTEDACSNAGEGIWRVRSGGRVTMEGERWALYRWGLRWKEAAKTLDKIFAFLFLFFCIF